MNDKIQNKFKENLHKKQQITSKMTKKSYKRMKEKDQYQNKLSINIGCRIPKNFFVTKGYGESDITIHAGSYHLALKQAGIESQNIMTYSSILPRIANKINRPNKLEHGAVMETIMASASGKTGENVTAGIIYGWLYDKETRKKYGGLVCEHNGNYTKKEITTKLKASLNELYINGFNKKYDLKGIELNVSSFVPKKQYGTSLVALCFIDYEIPIL